MTSTTLPPPPFTPLSHGDALLMLEAALDHEGEPRVVTPREKRLLVEVVERLDGLPASVTLVAAAIAREGVARVHAQITHDLGHLLFGPDTWGDAWERLDEARRQLLCWATQCHGGFDLRAIQEMFGARAEHTLTRCVERGQILGLDKERSSVEEEEEIYQVSWSWRMCVQAHLSNDERRALQHRHATYFLERAEAIPNARLGLVDYRNLQGAILAVLPYDAALATRCCTSLIVGARHLGSFEAFIALFEKVLAIRPCTPGDLLGIELLARLGELYRATDRLEQSVETLELAIAMEPPLKHRLAAGTRMALATSLSYIKEHERALEVMHEANEIYQIHGDAKDLSRARTCHGTIAFRARDYVLATQLFKAQVEAEPEDGSAQSNMAAIYSLRGMAREGLFHVNEVFAQVQRAPNPHTELIALNNAVAMELCEGHMSRALEHVRRSQEIYANLGTTAMQQYPLTLINEAVCQLLMHNLFDAHSFVKRALDVDSSNESAHLLALQTSALLGDFNTLREVQERQTTPSSSGPQSPHLTRAYTDLITDLAHHLHIESGDVIALQEKIEALDWSTEPCLTQLIFTHLADQIARLVPAVNRLWIHEKGEWAQRGSSSEERLDLRRSGVTRRLLLALVEAHANGQTCTAEMLFEAAWPGQIWNQSARVRLHTAIHRLRDRLLGELLVTQDDEGYCLAQTCQLERSCEPPPTTSRR